MRLPKVATLNLQRWDPENLGKLIPRQGSYRGISFPRFRLQVGVRGDQAPFFFLFLKSFFKINIRIQLSPFSHHHFPPPPPPPAPTSHPQSCPLWLWPRPSGSSYCQSAGAAPPPGPLGLVWSLIRQNRSQKNMLGIFQKENRSQRENKRLCLHSSKWEAGLECVCTSFVPLEGHWGLTLGVTFLVLDFPAHSVVPEGLWQDPPWWVRLMYLATFSQNWTKSACCS